MFSQTAFAQPVDRQIVVERLAAESQEDRNEWLKVFKEHLYGSIGGGVFSMLFLLIYSTRADSLCQNK